MKPPRPRRHPIQLPAHLRERDLYLDHGKALREKVRRTSHADFKPGKHRADPVKLLVESSKGRVKALLPIRYGRMLASPFAFYRGATAIMAYDLSHTPVTGEYVQACGDCHLANFGGFATAERRLIFDINDFDETLPAPWEWDVKRLAASFVIAGRNNGFKERAAKDMAEACVRSYRQHMSDFSKMTAMEVWYARLDMATVLKAFSDKAARERGRKLIMKQVERSVIAEDYPALVDADSRTPRIRDQPPLIFHVSKERQRAFAKSVNAAFNAYRSTLSEDRRMLLDRFQVIDVASKVVGVGSVGTRCGIMLLMAGPSDALFLQVKEARVSVLEAYAGKSRHANRGERVVVGQRLMQSASDLFLGWTAGRKERHFFVRQLRDMKIKPRVEAFDPALMEDYAGVCGWTLARAHARAGNAGIISGYLGS
ncbi:MAG TPA: DUF2252 domain-containing protein, partial [Candidatus Krumholzibacteria bacterium]|nr:DUF2252 domain-containing protein [Candidatus Krumholzibacteria bacterium]